MKNKIDKIFKDKLEGHSFPPSEEAWTRLEANLSKKNNAVYWRLAAAVLLMGFFISLIYWSKKSDVKPQSVTASQSNENKKPNAPFVAKSEQKPQLSQSLVKEKQTLVSKANKKSNSFTQSLQKQEEKTFMSSTEEKSKAISTAENSDPKEEKLINEATPAAKISSSKQKPIKLEFTLDDFTPEEKIVATNVVKHTGLIRVWELAKEVKNGEGPIHEMKNELFALNFKKSKNQ